jgi:Cu/Ag efflux pump CusA
LRNTPESTALINSSEGKPHTLWIVKVALDRPYTFIILALLILLLSPVIILRTPVDIFPNINIPVIAISWTYSGLNPEEFEGRVTLPYEKVLTTLVDNIQHIESGNFLRGSSHLKSSTSARRVCRSCSLGYRGRA